MAWIQNVPCVCTICHEHYTGTAREGAQKDKSGAYYADCDDCRKARSERIRQRRR